MIQRARRLAELRAALKRARVTALLLMKGSRRYGVEVKFQDDPRVIPSMRIVLADLGLHHLTVVYPGGLRYPLDGRIAVVLLTDLAADPGVITPTTRGRRP